MASSIYLNTNGRELLSNKSTEQCSKQQLSKRVLAVKEITPLDMKNSRQVSEF